MFSTTERTRASTRSQLRLPPNTSAPAAARAALRELEGSLPEPLLEKLGLIATELVTNSLRHAVTPDPASTLTLAISPERVTMTVADKGSAFNPDALGREPGTEGGFGLRLVDSIADRWWIERLPEGRGTRVICELELSSRLNPAPRGANTPA
jgi:two-component sensor histidine kinase